MDITARQKIWDAALIRSWHEDLRMWELLRRYFTEVSLLEGVAERPDDIFEMLENESIIRKPPMGGYGAKQHVRVLVSEQMPWLSNTLWDGKVSDDKLQSMLSGSQYDVTENKKEINSRARKRYVEKTQKGIRCVRVRPERRSDQWGVTKPVRSK